MNNKKGGFGAKLILVLILMIASAVGGAYGYRVIDGKLASREALKAIENVDVSDYDTTEQGVIQGYIDTAMKDIETAKTRKEVYEVITDFIADVAKVQTANEKKLEEALKAAEEAKNYNNNNNNNNSNNSNSLFNSNNNNDNSDSSYNSNDTQSEDQSGSYEDSSDSSSGNYKSNDLTNGSETEEEKGGLLNSLIGGLANGSGSN